MGTKIANSRASVSRVLALASILALWPGLVEPAVDPPQLLIEHGPGLQAAAARLEAMPRRQLVTTMDFIGLRSPGEPLRVFLATEDTPAASATPSWISGYAYPALGTVVLFPQRVPAYPHDSLEGLLRHEVAHILISRSVHGASLPRWFQEGAASLAGGSWSLEDRSRMTLTMVLDDDFSFSDLERRFGGERQEMIGAYVLAEAVLRDLAQRYGSDIVRRILRSVAAGATFERAFASASGSSLRSLEMRFAARHAFWYRWVPFLTSSFALWLGITLLFLLAAQRKRKQTRDLERRWTEEEFAVADSGSSDAESEDFVH